jgi:hypothetical protein
MSPTPIHVAIAILAAVAALDAAISLVERFRRTRNTLPPSPHIAPAPHRRKPPSRFPQ